MERPTERNKPLESAHFLGVVKPTDCAIIFGIPMTDDEYTEQLRSPSPRDFVRRVCKSRVLFARQIEQVTTRCLPLYASYGVTVVRQAPLTAVAEMIGQGKKAVLVFTHWQDDPPLVEFFDGMKTPQQVANSVSHSFGGVIDWCICNPAFLALLQYESMAHLRVWRNRKITPALWLSFFAVLFETLRDNELDYATGYNIAYEKVKAAL